jgi:carbonic anhydrase
VTATLETLRRPEAVPSRNLSSIVERIRPAIDTLVNAVDSETLLAEAVRANVRHSVAQLRHGSESLERLARQDGLVIVGAEYSLHSGLVDWLDLP